MAHNDSESIGHPLDAGVDGVGPLHTEWSARRTEVDLSVSGSKSSRAA